VPPGSGRPVTAYSAGPVTADGPSRAEAAGNSAVRATPTTGYPIVPHGTTITNNTPTNCLGDIHPFSAASGNTAMLTVGRTGLQRGRERHPSAEVINASGRVFSLDGDALAHLHPACPAAPHEATESDHVGPGLVALLERWHDTKDQTCRQHNRTYSPKVTRRSGRTAGLWTCWDTRYRSGLRGSSCCP
jgi:hypothetical protein